jgi:hypothetical protein
MSEYLNTIGRTRLAIGICGRCSLKFALDDLSPDINYPGLLVCGVPGSMTGQGTWIGGSGCSDMYDPYRLPPRETEDITLEMPRPDDRIITISVAPGDVNWPPSQFEDDGLQANQSPSDGNPFTVYKLFVYPNGFPETFINERGLPVNFV